MDLGLILLFGALGKEAAKRHALALNDNLSDAA
jgi:hypothetical protein